MNKIDLVEVVAGNAGITKVEAAKVVDAVFAGIEGALKKKEKVAIQGFGTFDVKVRAARKGTHPKTGETIEIPESKAVGFKVSKSLKDSL